MNQVPEEKKDSLTKTLAILWFVAIVILIVWLAVKIVALIPTAFSSLASIADSVYNNTTNSELSVNTKENVVNAGESFTISWNKLSGTGTYGFEYDCTDGVSLDIRDEHNAISPLDCDTFIELGTANKVDVLVHAEKQRFTDIEYEITYMRDNAENIVTRSVVTVVNPTIPTDTLLADARGTETEAINATDDTETMTKPETQNPTPIVRGEATTNTNNSTGGGSNTSTLTPGEPRVVKKYVWQIPASDPNGFVDLQVTHLGVGVMHNGVFVSLPELDEDRPGAIRFEVKNIGTKTATDWDYEAELPSDITYKSDDQKALKPNERVVITLGFDGITRTGIETFGAKVSAKDDINNANNDYSWKVKVVD